MKMLHQSVLHRKNPLHRQRVSHEETINRLNNVTSALRHSPYFANPRFTDPHALWIWGLPGAI